MKAKATSAVALVLVAIAAFVVVQAGSAGGRHLTLAKAKTGAWALVNSDGSIIQSSAGVSSQSLGTGTYHVFFPANLSNCAPLATVSSTGVPAFIDATRPSGTSVSVQTWDKTGALTDHAFYVALVCASKTVEPT
jgi:hypothetical protein